MIVKNLVDIQKKVIKYSYLTLFISIIVAAVLKINNLILSMILGSFISLLQFNYRMNSLRVISSKADKMSAKLLKVKFLTYFFIAFLLVIVKLYTDLLFWVVFAYCFMTNLILIMLSIFYSIKEAKGK